MASVRGDGRGYIRYNFYRRRPSQFKVHRSGYVNQDLFATERDAIFNKSWLYVGHESEIASPGI